MWSELREVVVNALLQFVVKNHAEIPSALAFDLFGCGVIHPIQVGIVVGFTGLGKAVMDGLILRNALRGRSEPDGPASSKLGAVADWFPHAGLVFLQQAPGG